MSMWVIVIVASVMSFAIKFSGYLIPQGFLQKPRFTRVTNLLTVSMLAALVAVQTLGVGQSIVLDARVPAVILAMVLFSFRVPFLVVVIVAGVVAVVLRSFGVMP